MARGKGLEDLYQQLDTTRGKKGIYKLAKLREKKTKDFSQVKCIENKNQPVLTGDNKIKKMWKSYFNKLLNLKYEQDFHNLHVTNRNFS